MKTRRKSRAQAVAGEPELTRPAPQSGESWGADGRLAAALAHEVNNSLDTMQNCLHLISGKVKPQGAPAYELLRTETARLGRLVREILGLSSSPQPASASDLNAAVSETLRALQPRLRRAQVAVTRSRGPRVRVAASSVELQLLVPNLVANAADAMPGGGKLRIETRVLPRRGVRLRVADTGTGIPAALASRIFQPFVSSKGDRGTGLGLWIVAQIAAQHGGRVRALPRRGGGTVMEVELPAAPKYSRPTTGE